MPSWTLADLMSQTTTRAGRRADLEPSDVSFWVNASYQEVLGLTEHRQLESYYRKSINSGTSYITVPSDFNAPFTLSIETDSTAGGSARTLTPVPRAKIDAEGFYPVGTPKRYAFWDDRIEIQPSSDTTYTLLLRYQSFKSDLVELTDVPSLDTEWRKAVLYLAEAEMWAFVDNPVQESIARQRYVNYVSHLENTAAKRQKGTPMYVHPIYPEVRAVSRRSFDVV